MIARNPAAKNRLARATRRAGRLINLQLAAEGAEIKLPALPRITLGWRSVSAIVFVWLLAMLLLVASSSVFFVSQLEVSGAQRLSGQDLASLLLINGRSIFSIVPENLETHIMEAYPELDGVAVSVAFPARIVIAVQERSPVLAWQQSGITVWVDEAGIAFIPQGELDSLPIIEAIKPPPDLIGDEYHRHQIIAPELVKTIKILGALAPQGLPLIYDPELGIGWQDEKGWTVFFGNTADDMEQRIAMYQSILRKLSDAGLTPTLISVAHLHAPYYRIDY